jgi:hypothetical protein
MAATHQPALTNIARHCKRTYDLFDPTGVNASHVEDGGDRLFALNYKIQTYFDHVKALPPPQAQRSGGATAKGAPKSKRTKITETADSEDRVVIEGSFLFLSSPHPTHAPPPPSLALGYTTF